MNIRLSRLLALASFVMIASCSPKLRPLNEKQVNVEPNPLAVTADHVPARIRIAFPAKSFPKKAMLRITPVLRYSGGEKWGQSYSYQGESVLANEMVIPYKTGANVELNFSVPYISAMQRSELFLTFTAKVGRKEVSLPALKVVSGVISTEALATAGGILPAMAPHGFERIIKEQYDADIMFQIQNANVRSSEISKEEVEEWRYTVQNAKETPNQNVSVEVQSYASPDGGKQLNERLSESRERNTTSSLKREFRKQDLAGVAIDAHYTAQDWEGFRQLVEQSDLPDKELVLRVLSMYPDPEQREREIKNISTVFRQLADDVLPKLRRSRLIANVEIVGKTDDEIKEWVAKAPGHLSISELLYAAELTPSTTDKMRIYQIVNQIFPKDYRAYNNMGALFYTQGALGQAEKWFARAAERTDNPVIKLNQGLMALHKGDKTNATTLISSGVNLPELGQALGYLYLKEGEYAKAETSFGETISENAVVAQIMNGNYSKALATLGKLGRPTAKSHLLGAIIAARTNNAEGVIASLKQAIALDKAVLYSLPSNLEFARYFSLPAFQALLQ